MVAPFTHLNSVTMVGAWPGRSVAEVVGPAVAGDDPLLLLVQVPQPGSHQGIGIR